jgi:PelA/Pel-15E family pectate lyase
MNKKLAFKILFTGLILSNFTFANTALADTDYTNPKYTQNTQIPSLNEFSDAINHYRAKREKYPTFEPNQFVEIADNILLLQHENGGFLVNYDPTKIFTPSEISELTKAKTENSASFDNRNIYSQINYLMEVYEITSEAKYRQAAINAIDFTIKNQFENCGGWPHSIPFTQSYHNKITIADEVLSGNVNNMRLIANAKYPYKKLPHSVKLRAKKSLNKADECILRLQIWQNGKLTGWAGQYENDTLLPSMGRKFELPSIASQESVEIIRYLMSIENPSQAQINAINCAILWLKESAIKGQKLETFKLESPIEFQYHKIDFDRRIVPDETAPLLWARFYDLKDNSIILANRDSIRVDSYEKIHIERRTGYNWYGNWPLKLIEIEYPKWQKHHDQNNK